VSATRPFVVAAPIVPDRGPARAGTRAEIEAHRRRLAAARVRRRNQVAADELESQAGAFGRHWRESAVNSQRRATAQQRETEARRQATEQRQHDDFFAARAAAHLEQDRQRFYASPVASAAQAAAAAAGRTGW
jgi:hypothetical protein